MTSRDAEGGAHPSELLKAYYQEDPNAYSYERLRTERGLLSLEEIRQKFEAVQKRIENLFTVLETEGTTFDPETDENVPNRSEIVASSHLEAKNPPLDKKELRTLRTACKNAKDALLVPLAFLSDPQIEYDESSALCEPGGEMTLLQVRYELLSFVQTLNDWQKEISYYYDETLSLKALIEHGDIEQAIRAALGSFEVWNEIDAAMFQDFLGDIEKIQKELPRSLAVFDQKLPQDIVRDADFVSIAKEFWNNQDAFQRYDTVLEIYEYLKALETKRSDLSLLLNHFDRPAKGKKLDMIKKQKVKEFYDQVVAQIKKFAPYIALAAAEGFLQHEKHKSSAEKDKWGRLTPKFKDFEMSLFPRFETVLEKAVVGDQRFTAVRNIRTGKTYSVSGDESPSEVASRLGGRMVIRAKGRGKDFSQTPRS